MPPVQVPGSAVSCSPILAVPEIVGLAVVFGAVLAETACVGCEVADEDPSLFEAVTARRSAWSTSPEVTL
jgi:hypothetical protein